MTDNIMSISKAQFMNIAERTIFENLTAYASIAPEDGASRFPLVWFAYNQKSTKQTVLNEIGKAQRQLIRHLKKQYDAKPLNVSGHVDIKVIG